MVSRTLLRKLLRDLLERKGALAALVVIAAIGVACYVGMASVFRDMDGSRAHYYREYQLADFSVDLKRAPLWTLESVAALPNVRSVRPRVNLAALIDLPHRDEPISGTVISMPEHRVGVLNDILLRSGTWFSGRNEKEVILNDAFAQANGLRPGHRIKILLLDKQHDLLVVGTAMSPEFVYLIPSGGGLAPDPERFGVLYLPNKFLQESCDLEGAYNQLVGLAFDNSRTALDNMLRLIEEKLDPYGVTNTTPIQEQASVRFLADELDGLRISATVMPAIFLGVAALVLNILIGRMVVQQRTIIGTLMAVGFSRGAVTRHYLAFGVIVGLAGGLVGVALGRWLQAGMVLLYRQFFALPSIQAHLYPDILLTGLSISVGFAVLGMLKGVWLAARLQPAEAMHPPPPERGGKVLPERIGFFWAALPFRWKLILRGVFRNPFRSTVSILASMISTALLLVYLSNIDSLIYLMDYEFEKVSHQDVSVALRDPGGVRALSEFGRMPFVSQTEPQLLVVCDISNGPFRKRTGVTGLPRGNRLYTPLDGGGRPIVVPEQGIVLTRKLSEILHARQGDTIRLRPLIARRQEVSAPVVGIVDTFLGLSAYADLGYLSGLLGEAESANMILGTSFRGPLGDAFLAELKQRPSIVGIGERTRSLTQMHETFGKTMGTAIVIMILLSGLIAFGSVLNTALVLLSERRREVGSLRVLGYSPEQVARIFTGESLLLSGVGILCGLAAGVGLAHLVSMAYNTELYRFPTIIYPSRLVISAALIALFVGLAQLIIYRMIRKLDWLEVLNVKE